MVNSAKMAVADEKQIVEAALNSIRNLIQAFESRAAAYDGQLEKAFQTYQTEVAKTVNQLESHGRGVQERFTDALGRLQTVVENAKAFEPESTRPNGADSSTGEVAG